MPKKKGKFQAREAEQIDAYYKEFANKNNKPKKKRPIVTVVIVLAVILCLCAGAVAVLPLLNEGAPVIITGNTTLQEGVTIGGVCVGGMNTDEAIEELNAAFDDYRTESMIVTCLEETLEITSADAGFALDAEAAVEDAFTCGTEENPDLELDITPYLHFDEDAIRVKLQELALLFPTDGAENTYEVVDTEVDGKPSQMLVITLGNLFYDFNADTVFDMIMDAYQSRVFSVSYDCTAMNAAALDLDDIYAQNCVEMVNAELDPASHEVTQSVVGYQFDLDAAKAAMAEAQPGDVLEFPFIEVQPEMTTETLKEMLFRDKLGTYTAYQASGTNRATNLKLACKALDGTILYPGDTFSYNKCLGERTKEKGYKPAASYVNGKTVESYGGGICQPSSALYYCTLLADLEIVQRACHSYPSSYVPLGLDATVDWNGPDFKFKNNTDFPIRIDAKADGGSVTVTLVGTDQKDYYVKMEYEVLSVNSPKTIVKEVKPGSGHKDGEVETTAYTGYTVQSYKLKYDKETDKLISREKEAYSVYSKRDKVVYKVIGEEKDEEETTPPTTEPKPTDPPATEPKPTDPPATEPKPTDPPATEPKPTDPPATEPKPTDPPATEPKPTDPPATEPKPTEAPAPEAEASE